MRKISLGLAALLIAASLLFALAGRTVGAQSGAGDDAVLKKLDDIIRAQKELAADIDAIRQDLSIIKIRVTQNQ
jgi:hypothetical protein